ncbi:MAG: lipopolysaccharide kinase InaA family protein [Phycisphaerae bacterium]|nr:hypothetical protein [Phycisphaerales bacterium]
MPECRDNHHLEEQILSMSLSDFDDLDAAFRIKGEPMQTHQGRSVTRLTVDGQTHFLKRFWLTPTQIFRRFVVQGMHELAMIDWLNSNNFTGPEVVARGAEKRLGVWRRMMFLMREANDELPLERFCRKFPDRRDGVLESLADHTARLHDAGFYHRDYSERHIFVRCDDGAYTFRQIDLERATVGPRREAKAAADLKTLSCSIADPELAGAIEGAFLAVYLAKRGTLESSESFRELLANAVATKSFE